MKTIEKTAKIVVLKQNNPFRPETAVHKRARAVLTSKTVADALKRGARVSTVRWLLEGKYVAVKPVAKKAAA
jgi:hypothetical protein